eukprot:2851869-Heterocapsa_arctica.AAC.1
MIARIFRDRVGVVAGNAFNSHASGAMSMNTPVRGITVTGLAESNDKRITCPHDRRQSALLRVDFVNAHPPLNIVGVINDTYTVGQFNGTITSNRQGNE